MIYIQLCLIFIATLIAINLIKKQAQTFGLVDVPNERSEHTSHTPRGAGIGFVSIVLLSIIIFQFDIFVEYIFSFVAISLVFAIGIYDDMHDSAPKVKFAFIIVATLLLYFDNIVIDDMGTYFGARALLGWFALPFTMFAVSGFTNALNLIDGLDGLSGSLSIIIFAIFAILGYNCHDDFIFYVALYFMISLMAFLVFNWNPASIFMGDSGSLTLGFVIAMLGIKSLEYLPAVSMLFVTGLPIMDTLVVMFRRKLSGKSAFQPDKCHIHHILKTFFGDNVKRTVSFLIVMQSIYAIIGLLFDNVKDDGMMMVLFLMNVLMLYLLIQAMIKRQERVC
jgi:UDP-GlcNAc:undecaprenyl-phosphate GlcNAc-1-phosphate transferase